jgi:DNA-binding IclR family transcriptional regulator
MTPPKKKYYQISSLQKGLKILELLIAEKELTVSRVAEILGINRAGSHRFLATLRDLGYVEKNAEGRYQATLKILELGMKVADRFEIRSVARPYMQELSDAFNETVNLGLWNGRGILHLDKIDSREILRMDTPLGSTAPAYCTALGKVILAYLPAGDQDDFLAREKLQPLGPNTITSKEKLKKELKKIRKKGFAVDNEELAAGLRCVAAAVFNHTGQAHYAISVSGPSMRLKNQRIEKIQRVIREICSKLSHRLGDPGDHDKEGL